MKEKILNMSENRVIVQSKTCSLHAFLRNVLWMTEDCSYIYNDECRNVWASGSPDEATVCPQILAVHTVQALVKLHSTCTKGPGIWEKV